MNEIPLEEAIQDYKDNERDIKIFELMIDGGWERIISPKTYLAEALEMRKRIRSVIEEQGRAIPLSELEKLKNHQKLMLDRF